MATAVKTRTKRSKKGKTGLSRPEWQKIFKQSVEVCRERAKKEGIRFQDCMREELSKYRK